MEEPEGIVVTSTKVALSTRRPSTSLSSKTIKPPTPASSASTKKPRPQSAVTTASSSATSSSGFRSRPGTARRPATGGKAKKPTGSNLKVVVPTARQEGDDDGLDRQAPVAPGLHAIGNRRRSSLPPQARPKWFSGGRGSGDDESRSETSSSSSGAATSTATPTETASSSSGNADSDDEEEEVESSSVGDDSSVSGHHPLKRDNDDDVSTAVGKSAAAEAAPSSSVVSSGCNSPRSAAPSPEKQRDGDRDAKEEDDELDLTFAASIAVEKRSVQVEIESTVVENESSPTPTDGKEALESQEVKEAPSVVSHTGGTTSSCTISAVSSFTPDSLAPASPEKGYEDLLKALERMEDAANARQEVSLEKKAEEPPKAASVSSGRDTMSEASKSKGSDKIGQLFSFLDSVEKETDVMNDTAKISPDFCAPNNDRAKSAENKRLNSIMTLSKESPQRLAEKLVRSGYQMEEHERSISVLKKALEQQKRISASMSTKFQKEMEARLQQQKEEYEATVRRHQTFIDQLIEDKRSLSERCDHLHLELKNRERKHQESARGMEQRHAAELRRIKSLSETSTKIRQEKWMDEKTRRIKEQTVRGLEPEIQRLMSRHSAEVTELEAEKDRLLFGQERELHQRHVQHVRELKALWDEEQHEALQRERQVMLQRHQVQLNELAEEHQRELERMQEHMRRERQRAAEERAHLEREAEQVRRSMHERSEAEVERVREEEEGKRRVLVKKHAAELASLKESESSDRSAWERDFRQKVEEEWATRQAETVSKVRAEAETEIRRAEHRREKERKAEKEASKRDVEERVRRARDKFDMETREVEAESESLRKRLGEARERCARLEEESIVSRANIKQRDVELEELQKTNGRLESERDDVRQAVRGEFAAALEGLSQERGHLLKEVAELRHGLAEMKSAKEATEQERRREVEEEVEKIHQRVKTAIVRKDELIRELRQNNESLAEQNHHLEAMLERQTKEKLFIKT